MKKGDTFICVSSLSARLLTVEPKGTRFPLIKYEAVIRLLEDSRVGHSRPPSISRTPSAGVSRESLVVSGVMNCHLCYLFPPLRAHPPPPQPLHHHHHHHHHSEAMADGDVHRLLRI